MNYLASSLVDIGGSLGLDNSNFFTSILSGFNSSSSDDSSSDVNEIDMDKLDDSDEEGAGSYAKFKTKNELDQVEIEKQGPKFEVK